MPIARCIILMFVFVWLPTGIAQTPCPGISLTGTVVDTTNALIPNALVELDGKASAVTDGRGRFRFRCVPASDHSITVQARDFGAETQTISTPRVTGVTIKLKPSVETVINVNEDRPLVGGGASLTITGRDLQLLADDPDDLQRELQQLGALSGGNPSQTIISVNGFQGAGTIPPKSSIAFIQINPDRYSAEYREPPLGGGRVEIYTKPGGSRLHGALFGANSSPWMNAQDPLSNSPAALGKQRYGFELSGPIKARVLDFSATLEYRSINNFAVVDAVTLNQANVPTSEVANVPTPETLWIGTLRSDWQFGQKNTGFVSFDTYVNQLTNAGVGGITLASAGYGDRTSDQVIRAADETMITTKLLNEIRMSLEWRHEVDSPLSLAPQIQVAGSFTGGGATIGHQQINELITEVDNNVIYSRGKHLLKSGFQLMAFDEHRMLPTNFNGTYIFSGRSAPVLDENGHPTDQVTELTALQQYQRALQGLPGGEATQYSNVVGSGEVQFTQVRTGLFLQDLWKIRNNISLSLGFRYFVQNAPSAYNGAVPRAGVVWSPAKHKTWTLHAHVGLFSGVYNPSDYAELKREDGIRDVTSLIYNAIYEDPFSGNATVIESKRTIEPGFHAVSFGSGELGFEKTFHSGLRLAGSVTGTRIWGDDRSVNINSPMNGQPNGSRPYGPNLNILQWQNSGYGLGDMEVVGASDRFSKRLRINISAIRNNLRQDSDDSLFFSPQSQFSDAGEVARNSGQALWQIFGSCVAIVPFNIQLSASYYGVDKLPYNITTGADNNGDGNFNDRPQVASPGQAGAIETRYGFLVDSGGESPIRRNLGELPWDNYLDVNIQRTFDVRGNAKADNEQSFTVNLRSSNVINHLNVTAEGGILGSPLFGAPYTADNGRRIELGFRYDF